MQATLTRVELDGKEYVIIQREAFDRRSRLAEAAAMPPWSKPNMEGNVLAVEYARASSTRTIIHERKCLGLAQNAPAGTAGVRLETICRIERAGILPAWRP